MRLSRYLEPELAFIDLEADSLEDVITRMVDRAHAAGQIDDRDAVRDAVLERERSHTTALGNGVALPHALVDGLAEARVVVAVAPGGVRFSDTDPDAAPERLFFMLLSPTGAAGTHIKLLARIVRLVRRRAFVDALIQCESAERLIAEIEREDALHV